jgi:hypothetical protein
MQTQRSLAKFIEDFKGFLDTEKNVMKKEAKILEGLKYCHVIIESNKQPAARYLKNLLSHLGTLINGQIVFVEFHLIRLNKDSATSKATVKNMSKIPMITFSGATSEKAIIKSMQRLLSSLKRIRGIIVDVMALAQSHNKSKIDSDTMMDIQKYKENDILTNYSAQIRTRLTILLRNINLKNKSLETMQQAGINMRFHKLKLS